MIDKINKLIERYNELQTSLGTTEVISSPQKMQDIGREYSALGKNLPRFNAYLTNIHQLAQAKGMLKNESDTELLEMIKEEVRTLEEGLPALEEEIRRLLVPKNPNDLKNAIVEIRAGTGGTEASLFCADLYRMYTHFAENKKFSIEVLSSSLGDLGSIKEIIFMVKGDNAYGTFKFESGVHRVQRIPQTETMGRIHTSAASVAVFPEADEFEVKIDPADLRVDVYRSSGHGGQSVNTTDSAVRIVHVPTGLTVTCQDEKSQLKNKVKALKILQSRLFDKMQSEQQAKNTADRRSMVGTGDRSEKIRTYNFPQNRVTDHRINLTLYKLEMIINGDIQELVDALSTADLEESIKNFDI